MKNFISEDSLVKRSLEFKAGFIVGILLVFSAILFLLDSLIEYFAIALVSLLFFQSVYHLHRALKLPEYLSRAEVVGFLFYCIGLASGIIASIVFLLRLLLITVIILICVALFLLGSYHAMGPMYHYL